MAKKIIDGKGLILGRMCSEVAKMLLIGDEVEIVNSENCVVMGKKLGTIKHYKEKLDRGHPKKGPFFPNPPHLLVKRTIRGMLPKGTRGRELMRKLMVHIGNPENKNAEKLKCDVSMSNDWRYMNVGELSVMLGAKKRW